jgi:ATP-dependent exoDNAse (exonuclease V) alpha subunit
MTSGELFLSFLKAIPTGSKVVLAGEVQQLTPIGSCQVFADVLNCGVIPTVRLTKPHRQALKSGIIPLSMSIINQEPVCDSTFQGKQILGELRDMELDVFKDDLTPSTRVIKHFLEQYEQEENLMEVQVAVPMKNRGDMCTYNLNLLIQDKINPINENRKNIIVSLDKERFYTIQTGDKVINTKNNYNAKTLEGDDVAVFNGNMGIVKEIKDGFITIDFDGIGEVVLDGASSKSLELGYACTIHKLQGSQFKRLIFAINSSDFILLNAELGYTGITRASKYCVFVFKNQAMKTMVNKREVKNKQTYLSMILQEQLLKSES